MSEDSFKPYYQRGIASVQHRNIDAAGDDHPFGDEARAFEADLRHLIRKVADDLYESWEATIREYLANAETACLKTKTYVDNPSKSPYSSMIVDDSYQPKVEVEWNESEDRLTISDNGIGMAAEEVDEIFRQIGHSAARDDGSLSGQFGMGALSFVKLVGLDSAMLMTSHSRLNDDNASYYVTLAGIEPIRGSLDDDEYGTVFQMTPQDSIHSMSIRDTIEQYAQWMRVPVRYEEIDSDGRISFQEDYGNKKLYDGYGDDKICLGAKKEGYFEAYCSPDARGRTLLLSMKINRNDGRYSSTQKHDAPFSFDVRILDESGRVIKSSNGNEGLMPVSRADYVEMLKEARDPHITRDLLNNADIVAQHVVAGPHADAMVVADDVLASDKPLPSKYEYVARSSVTPQDVAGDAEVIIGPHEGKIVVSEDEWDSMDAGRAAFYVPETDLERYDVETGEGDLTLPQPTSDRDRLQSDTVFWEYIASTFRQQFDERVREVFETIDQSDDKIKTIQRMSTDENLMNIEEAW